MLLSKNSNLQLGLSASHADHRLPPPLPRGGFLASRLLSYPTDPCLFYGFEDDFSLFPDLGHWNGRSLLHLCLPQASSSSALLYPRSPPSFEPFFFFFYLFAFFFTFPFPDLDLQIQFWPASKSKCQIITSLALFFMFLFIHPLTSLYHQLISIALISSSNLKHGNRSSLTVGRFELTINPFHLFLWTWWACPSQAKQILVFNTKYCSLAAQGLWQVCASLEKANCETFSRWHLEVPILMFESQVCNNFYLSQ